MINFQFFFDERPKIFLMYVTAVCIVQVDDTWADEIKTTNLWIVSDELTLHDTCTLALHDSEKTRLLQEVKKSWIGWSHGIVKVKYSEEIPRLLSKNYRAFMVHSFVARTTST